MELQKDGDVDEVMEHLSLNVPDYYSDVGMREHVLAITDYHSEKLMGIRSKEADAAKLLSEPIRNQRLG